MIKSLKAQDLVAPALWELCYQQHSLQQIRSLFTIHSFLHQRHVEWGIGGSVGYELASGISVANANSDLDIILYMDAPLNAVLLKEISDFFSTLPCKLDVQIEARLGAASLYELAQQTTERVMIKSNKGPYMLDRFLLF